jgi:hypothetical protein
VEAVPDVRIIEILRIPIKESALGRSVLLKVSEDRCENDGV